MKSRLVLAGVVVALVAVVVSGCSSDNTVESGSAKTSDSRPRSSGSDGSGSGTTDTTIPDLGDVAGSLGDCMGVAGTYASLALNVLDGEDGAKKAQKDAESLKSKLPADLADDIDVVADTFGRIAQKGVLSGASELDDPAFTKANDNITKYLQTQCGGG